MPNEKSPAAREPRTGANPAPIKPAPPRAKPERPKGEMVAEDTKGL